MEQDKHELPIDLLQHQVRFGATVFLLVFAPITLLQIIGFTTFIFEELVETQVRWWSVGVSVGLLTGILIFVAVTLSARLRARWFYPGLVLSIAIILAGWLLHMHLSGSQNSPMPLLIVTTLFLASWFLKERDTVILLVLSALSIGLVVWLEFTGAIAYAPLLRQGDQLREFFMDGRIVFRNLVIFVATVTVIVAIMARVRSILARRHEELLETNQQLREQIRKREAAEKEKELLIKELRTALSDVKTLSGLVPICSSCKKIRDDKGFWNQLESYLRDRAEVTFTHGLCPQCADEILAVHRAEHESKG